MMKVFLSSTYNDLIEHRKAAHDALERMKQEVEGMEIFGAHNEEPKTVALAELEQCHLVIGIYAYRYGFIPDGDDISITEQEYIHAKNKGIPVLCFVVGEKKWDIDFVDTDEKKKKLDDLKARILKGKTVDFFTTPADLAMKIATSVHNHLERKKTGAKRKQLLLPTIVVSMDKEEASKLQDGSVLEDYAGKKEKQIYKELLETLEKEGCKIPFENYKDDRDLWEPPFGNGKTISDLIENGLNKINPSDTKDEKAIIGYSITDEFFNGEVGDVHKNEFVKLAKEEGCIIIIDAISLFHPLVRKRLNNSNLPSQPKSAVIFISPTITNSNPVTQRIEEFVSAEMNDVFERYGSKGEIICEMNIGDPRSFERWLFTAVSVETQMARNPNALLENILELQKILDTVPKGINRSFYKRLKTTATS